MSLFFLERLFSVSIFVREQTNAFHPLRGGRFFFSFLGRSSRAERKGVRGGGVDESERGGEAIVRDVLF